MSLHKQHGDASTCRIPLRVQNLNVTFSGKIDLMKTVYPRHNGFRTSLSLSIVPEDPVEEEAISVLSVVVPAMEGTDTKKRRFSGLVELVIDMALIMRRKFLRARRFADQEISVGPCLQ